ncbi:MAG: efflux RND transporter periplasmic adaptor subunit [Bacteroidetes bacterium]|nr:efflux RND transporter periplasmic adaptor subunit [Bacteroidota bacterium]
MERSFDAKDPNSGPATCLNGETESVYACSMHPQTSHSQPGNCLVCGMKLVDKQVSSFFNPDLLPLQAGEVEQMNVRTMLVGEKPEKGGNSLRLRGKLEPDQSRLYQQVCHLPGRIEKLYVTEEGSRVRKGQAIASIYSKELVAALETYHFNKRAESLARSALNNLKAWKVPASFYTKVDMTGDYHIPADVYSDFDGIVWKKRVVEGSYAMNTHMGHPTVLYDVADLSVVWAVLEVFESELRYVKEGMTIDLEVPAYPGETFSGKIIHIGDEVDPVTRTIPVRVSVANKEWRLKPGMLVEAEPTTSVAAPKSIVIPKSAILWTGERSVVYVRKPAYDRPVFAFTEVKTGMDMGENIVIVSGIKAGDEVVVQGAFMLDASAQLQGRKSMIQTLDSKKSEEDHMVANQ